MVPWQMRNCGGLAATEDLSYTKLIVGDQYINITSTKIVAGSLEGIIMKNVDLYGFDLSISIQDMHMNINDMT